jgi:hypothetical protein
LGFVATSDGAHPTQAAHRVIALSIASHLIQGFSVSLGDNFIQKAQDSYFEAETIGQEALIPLTPLNKKNASAPQDLSGLTAATVELSVKPPLPIPTRQNLKGIEQQKPRVALETKPKPAARKI